MTGMLASVNSIEEAQLLIHTSIDIIDLKQPQQGALGALSIETVKQIAARVKGLKPLSATVGDLPMDPKILTDAVTAMADTGVDYVKIGFFPDGNWQNCVDQLSIICRQGYRLIAVLFADTQPDLSIIRELHAAGFAGVMLDTMNKSHGSLTEVMPMTVIEEFVQQAKNAELLCGLAGSLKKTDISTLLPLEADYLGFRGALCDQHDRTAALCLQAIENIMAQFDLALST